MHKRLLRSSVFAVAMLAGLTSAPGLARQSPSPRAGDRTTTAKLQRAQILERFARAYFPGRTGQLMIVPREGDILTRTDPNVTYMHGSPWPYDSEIPMMFAGPGVVPGVYAVPATQQDVAATLAGVLGVTMPPTATGRALPGVKPTAQRPRAILLLVLDGTRPDYLERHASEMPTLGALRKKGAWFTNARVNYVPTNTAAGHATIATGADPRAHGITGNNLFDRVQRKRHDMMEGWNPRDLVALTLADVWQVQTGGTARVIGQGSSVPSSTALAGHGACQVGGAKTVHAGYDENAGVWKTNAECFVLAPAVAALDARTLWPPDGLWMGHKIDTPSDVRRSGLFPRFEADAFIRAIESQPIGEDAITDLLLLNYKGADYVGHKHGPESRELAATLAEMDRHLARILKAVEAKVGGDYLIAMTADHGMPSEPKTKDNRHFAPHIIDMLHARFDPDAKSLITYYEPENSQIFVDLDRLAALKLTLEELASFLQSKPFVYAVFTEDEVRRAAQSTSRNP